MTILDSNNRTSIFLDKSMVEGIQITAYEFHVFEMVDSLKEEFLLEKQ